jgi:hypothetical protein
MDKPLLTFSLSLSGKSCIISGSFFKMRQSSCSIPFSLRYREMAFKIIFPYIIRIYPYTCLISVGTYFLILQGIKKVNDVFLIEVPEGLTIFETISIL